MIIRRIVCGGLYIGFFYVALALVIVALLDRAYPWSALPDLVMAIVSSFAAILYAFELNRIEREKVK